jgi:hypothetical protein
MFRSHLFVAIAFIFTVAATRLLPHPDNFSPMIAVSLFGGAYLTRRWMAVVIPILAMFVSDIFLGFHDLMIPIYAMMIGFSFLGRNLANDSSAFQIGATTVGSSLIFFIASNFLVWLTSGMYSLDLSGLIHCFMMAIPFFQNQILGDMLFSSVLFGGMYIMIRNRLVTATVRS